MGEINRMTMGADLATIKEKRVKAQKGAVSLKKRLEGREGVLNALLFAEQVLDGLLKAHAVSDPGERGPAYALLVFPHEQSSFSSDFIKSTATPAGFLSEKGREKLSRSIPFSSFVTEKCPICQAFLPVIQELEYLSDLWDGKGWRKRFFVVCVPCGGAFEIWESEERECRF